MYSQSQRSNGTQQTKKKEKGKLAERLAFFGWI
jgi:hypothetical protein